MPHLPQPGVSIHKKSKTFKGFTLYSPIRGTHAYLLNMAGDVVHRWALYEGGINHAMLLDNGNLFISEFGGGVLPVVIARGGRLREYDWDGNLVWEHVDIYQHHDARRLANGNTAYIAWQTIPKKVHPRVKGGIKGSTAEDGHIYGDVIREVNQAGEVVWEWRCWEHMQVEKYPIMALYPREEFGHANTLVPLANGDYMIGFRVINTILIVDRKTKKIKWEMRDDSWGGQHDPHILPNKNILLFANGQMTSLPHPFSRILEINPRTCKTVWEYRDKRVLNFWSPFISGADRLPNGNTLICEGGYGRFFEITREGETVWEYNNPYITPSPLYGNKQNWVFRAHRYAASSPQIRRRVKQ
ncbi:MAG: aryl-sulfate sulfotransferase [Rhodospirillales bacterium]|jgi:hypothetical protein|nr:aryl sulfotransferase [Rhodospirillaceae bacterium]MDP6428039.1 aryl-sulfate sulfotransferase [Rhodospirillales bacterium]MDP6643744.1 aryl-sulfate sulfotransferase [Rhodospirillales bacterium]MDP6843214.1 aryl-sulfate sulfotransferase [Rhodospirillales bacterium]|tara:strand:- start:241 stop:1311 length:1071 start_codon:yes stop_codon:yes gene_type:complete